MNLFCSKGEDCLVIWPQLLLLLQGTVQFARHGNGARSSVPIPVNLGIWFITSLLFTSQSPQQLYQLDTLSRQKSLPSLQLTCNRRKFLPNLFFVLLYLSLSSVPLSAPKGNGSQVNRYHWAQHFLVFFWINADTGCYPSPQLCRSILPL